MLAVPTTQPTRLSTYVDRRRLELDLIRWRDLADRAGLSEDTIRAICERTTPPTPRQTRAERKLEAALGWQAGSLQAIREGREPISLSSDDLEERILADDRLNTDDKATLLHLYRTMRDKK